MESSDDSSSECEDYMDDSERSRSEDSPLEYSEEADVQPYMLVLFFS